jgi:PPP family 3-phenylpropionic acid transporter
MKQHLKWGLSSYYALIFMGGASFFSYIGLYYAHIKLSDTQIGLIAAFGPLIGLISQPIWGSLADRSTNKTPIIGWTLAGTALATWLIPLAGNNFSGIVAAVAALGFFSSATLPISDSVTLELAQQNGFKFSTVRTAGSLGFAIMAFVAGNIFDQNIMYIFPLFFIIRLATLVNLCWVPPVAGHPKTAAQARFLDLFRDRKLVYIYIYVFLLSCTLGFFNAFNAIYCKRLGIPLSLVGLGITVGSFSQFPFMLFFNRIYKRLGIVKILLIAGAVYVLRWILYATFLNAATVVPIWTLHGFNFIILYLCLAEYVSHTVPPELRTRGQVMNTIMLMGLSTIVGSSLGGWASSRVGLQIVFAAGAVLCLAVLIWFALVTKYSKAFREPKKMVI